jgi:Flp pilus assembly protein TadG
VAEPGLESAPEARRGGLLELAADRLPGVAAVLAEQRGQATVELVAAVPALLLAAAVALQLLVAGYTLTLADGAAEAGALALASGGSAAEAARAALPGWAEDDVSVKVAAEEVSVRLRPPSPFGALADRLAVESTASARAAK